MSTLSSVALWALWRAEAAQEELVHTKSARSRNRAEQRYYAACDALYQTLRSDSQVTQDLARHKDSHISPNQVRLQLDALDRSEPNADARTRDTRTHAPALDNDR